MCLSFSVCQFQSLWCWFLRSLGACRFGLLHGHGHSWEDVAPASAHQQQRMCPVRQHLRIRCRYKSWETLILREGSQEITLWSRREDRLEYTVFSARCCMVQRWQRQIIRNQWEQMVGVVLMDQRQSKELMLRNVKNLQHILTNTKWKEFSFFL